TANRSARAPRVDGVCRTNRAKAASSPGPAPDGPAIPSLPPRGLRPTGPRSFSAWSDTWVSSLFRHSDGDRAFDAGKIALSILDGNGYRAALEILDRRGEFQLAHALGRLLEPRRQVLARLDAVDRKIGRHDEARRVDARGIVVHTDENSRQF